MRPGFKQFCQAIVENRGYRRYQRFVDLTAAAGLEATPDSISQLPPGHLLELIYRHNLVAAEDISEVVGELFGRGRFPRRFVAEFLQNADDAQSPSCRFSFSSDKIVVENEGQPFSSEDIFSIASFLKSTKAAKDRDYQIGRFGVGFKSVFAVSDRPCIFSTHKETKQPVTFRLPAPGHLDQDAARRCGPLDFSPNAPESASWDFLATRYGYILPEHLTDGNGYHGLGSRFELPLREEIDPDELLADLVEGQVEIRAMLFLNHLEKVEIISPGEDGRRSWTRADIEKVDTHSESEKATLYRLDDGAGRVEDWLRFGWGPLLVPDSIKALMPQDLRDAVPSQATIHLAAPVQDEEIRPIGLDLRVSNGLPDGRLYSFLPVGDRFAGLKSGTAFHVNAPFNLTLERDRIHDDAYNKWLQDKIGEAVGKFCHCLAGSRFRRRLYTLIPRRDWPTERIPEVVEAARQYGRSRPCLPDVTGAVVPAKGALLVDFSVDCAEAIHEAMTEAGLEQKTAPVIPPYNEYLRNLSAELGADREEALVDLVYGLFLGEGGVRLCGQLGDRFYELAARVTQGLTRNNQATTLNLLPVPLAATGEITTLEDGEWATNEGTPGRWLPAFPEVRFLDSRVVNLLEEQFGDRIQKRKTDWKRSLAKAALTRLTRPEGDPLDEQRLRALEFLAACAPTALEQVRGIMVATRCGDSVEVHPVEHLACWPGVPAEISGCALRLADGESGYPESIRRLLADRLEDYTWEHLGAALARVPAPSEGTAKWVVKQAQRRLERFPEERAQIRSSLEQLRLRTLTEEYRPIHAAVDLAADGPDLNRAKRLFGDLLSIDWGSYKDHNFGLRGRLEELGVSIRRFALYPDTLRRAANRARRGPDPVGDGIFLARLVSSSASLWTEGHRAEASSIAWLPVDSKNELGVPQELFLAHGLPDALKKAFPTVSDEAAALVGPLGLKFAELNPEQVRHLLDGLEVGRGEGRKALEIAGGLLEAAGDQGGQFIDMLRAWCNGLEYQHGEFRQFLVDELDQADLVMCPRKAAAEWFHEGAVRTIVDGNAKVQRALEALFRVPTVKGDDPANWLSEPRVTRWVVLSLGLRREAQALPGTEQDLVRAAYASLSSGGYPVPWFPPESRVVLTDHGSLNRASAGILPLDPVPRKRSESRINPR